MRLLLQHFEIERYSFVFFDTFCNFEFSLPLFNDHLVLAGAKSLRIALITEVKFYLKTHLLFYDYARAVIAFLVQA